MKKSEAAPAIVWAALMLANCSSPPPAPQTKSINPLTISEGYVRQHFPKAIPQGSKRTWVEDHGDRWIVEISPQEQMGGGIKVIVSKQDGRVLGSQRTQ